MKNQTANKAPGYKPTSTSSPSGVNPPPGDPDGAAPDTTSNVGTTAGDKTKTGPKK